MRVMLTTLVVVLVAASATSAETDPCVSVIPTAVRSRISNDFPDRMSPHVSDNDPDDVKYSVEHGGSGCLRVATADVDGDGYAEIALLLRNSAGTKTKLVVYRKRNGDWRPEDLEDFDHLATSKVYVERCPPGEYRITQSLEGVGDEPGARSHLASRRPGFCSGLIGSADIFFAWQSGRWLHVQTTN